MTNHRANRYAQHLHRTYNPPQTEPVPGLNQIQNAAGGYVFDIGKWGQLRRVLILGTIGGTYYVDEKTLTGEAIACVQSCLAEDAERTVKEIVQVSDSGIAPKNDHAVFCLALAAANPTVSDRRFAYEALPKVCRTFTHLSQFISSVRELRGMGSGLRKAIQRWYTDQTADDVAYSAVKYQQREGFAQRDVIRLVRPEHVKDGNSMNAVLRWIATEGKGMDGRSVMRKVDGKDVASPVYVGYDAADLPRIIHGFEKIKNETDVKRAAGTIREYNLPRECVPTGLLNKPEIWEALLEKMPLNALIRNLGNMSKCGLVKPYSDASSYIKTRLVSLEDIKWSRIHPFNVFIGMKTYASGQGFRGKGTWEPDPTIVSTLRLTMDLAFGNVKPTHKNLLVAIDVSGSMSAPAGGSVVSCKEAAAAMAYVIVKSEPNALVWLFADRLYTTTLGRHSSLEDLMYAVHQHSGGTDIALPWRGLSVNKYPMDAVVSFTDTETWAGDTHVYQSMENARRAVGRQIKGINCAMTATKSQLSLPGDKNALEICGFDASLPTLISQFVAE